MSALQNTRRRLEDAIELAVARLDAFEGDPAFEADNDNEDGADDELSLAEAQ